MRPLEGVRIVELGRVLACPFAGMILAELGADVIKVEHPRGGDETRSYEPFFAPRENGQSAAGAVSGADAGAGPGAGPGADAQRGERSGYFHAFNRGKRSVTVNFRAEAGRQIIRDLAATSDALIENFPTGTLTRYGLDWETLRAVNERLVYVSCTGFGQTGPERSRKGYDTVFQAMGGVMSLTGAPGGGPVKAGIPVADLTSGLWIALAVASALIGRQTSGRGAYVDLSMMDGLISLMGLPAARYFALGEVPERMGTEHPGRVPSATFCTADGGHIHITGADQHWAGLCRALEIEAWGADPQFATNSGRVAARPAVMSRLAGAIGALPRDEVMARLDREGVPNGPVRTLDEVLSAPQTVARDLVRKVDHPVIGTVPGIALPLRFDGFDPPGFTRGPLLGEHGDEVLTGLLGYSPEQVAALRKDGIL